MPYSPHIHFIPPPATKNIWKYTDLVFLLDMIMSSSLHFTRIDCFPQDDSDGLIPKSQLTLDAPMFRKHKGTPYKTGSPREVLGEKAGLDFIANIAAHNRRLRSSLYANCWTISDHELDMFWTRYTTRSSGLAIQTTVGSLISAIEKSDEQIFVSPIKYYNPEREHIPTGNAYAPAIYKNIRFKADNELRLFLHDSGESIGPKKTYKKIPVDISKTIEKIVFPAHVNIATINVLETILKKFDLNIPIQHLNNKY